MKSVVNKRFINRYFFLWLLLLSVSSVAFALKAHVQLVAVGFAVLIPLSLISWCLSRAYLLEGRYSNPSASLNYAFIPEIFAFLGLYLTSLVFPDLIGVIALLTLGIWVVFALGIHMVASYGNLSLSLLVWNTWLLGTGVLALTTDRFASMKLGLEAAVKLKESDNTIVMEIIGHATGLLASLGVPLLVGGTTFLAAVCMLLYYLSMTAEQGQSVMRMKIAAYAVGFAAFGAMLFFWIFLPLFELILQGYSSIG
jgi:hypothetical protein